MSVPLLLLHGAIGSRTQFDALAARLAGAAEVHAFDFEGHGAAAPRDRPYRTASFAENVIEFLDEKAIASARIFGYSMGGYVGLYTSLVQPSRVERVMTLATKFRWTPESAAREGAMLDARKIEEKVPHFARALEGRHSASGWTVVLERTREMMESLGRAPDLTLDRLATLSIPVRIAVGDRDSTVSVEESAEIAKTLPNGELEVLPGTPHPLEKAPLDRLARSIAEFLI